MRGHSMPTNAHGSYEEPRLFPVSDEVPGKSLHRMASSSTMGKVVVRVNLPIDLGRWLQDEARARGTTISQYVTEKIAQLHDGSIWAQ